MTTELLFVYGTLKHDERQPLAGYTPAPRYLGQAWTCGRLYDLGDCPALVLDASEGPVWGEVYELDSKLFEELNQYETLCGDFRLRETVVWNADGAQRVKVYEIGPAQILPENPMDLGRWSSKMHLTEFK